MTTATIQIPAAPTTREPAPAAGAELDVDVHAVTVRRTDEAAPWTGRAPAWVWQCSQACYTPDGVAHMRPRQALSHALTHAAARLHLTVEAAQLEQFYAAVLSYEQQLADDTPAAAAGILIDPARLRVHELRHPTPAVAT